MLRWGEFAADAPELAAYGAARFNRARVAFLATVADDGTPRVNPVDPVICQGHLLLFLEPTSPKVDDLVCNGAFAMHALVDNPAGVGGEFSIKGRAICVDDPVVRQRAADASCYTPPGDFVLFELRLDAALMRDHHEGGEWVEKRWEHTAAAAGN